MCFHYSLTKKAKALKARFNIEELDDEELAEYLHFHANGFAHPKMPVITHDEPHRLIKRSISACVTQIPNLRLG